MLGRPGGCGPCACASIGGGSDEDVMVRRIVGALRNAAGVI